MKTYTLFDINDVKKFLSILSYECKIRDYGIIKFEKLENNIQNQKILTDYIEDPKENVNIFKEDISKQIESYKRNIENTQKQLNYFIKIQNLTENKDLTFKEFFSIIINDSDN